LCVGNLGLEDVVEGYVDEETESVEETVAEVQRGWQD